MNNFSSLEIRPVRHDEKMVVIPLLNEVFGPRQGTLDALQNWIDTPLFSVVGAMNDQECLGVSVARWQEDGKWAKELPLPKDVLNPYLNGRRIGTFQIMAVPVQYRRKGIAERLALVQLEWMKSQKCQGAIGMAWQHGSTDTSEHLFRKGGFDFLGDLPGFYLEGSRKSQHLCPVCQGECHCLARLYGSLWDMDTLSGRGV